ncbi:MAG TPA: hypothetical protein VFH27_17395 [Longimicrobiaceae bacterium]|nr:hypothetical protein [Longimicrobiaceae bacterium]
MFNWLRGKRLSAEARRKLLIAQARSEEAIISTHVDNVLEMMEMLAGELDVERALEEYAGMMPMDETIAATVTNRVLTRSLHPGAPPARAGRPAAPRREPTQRPFENVFRDPPRGDAPRKRR